MSYLPTTRWILCTHSLSTSLYDPLKIYPYSNGATHLQLPPLPMRYSVTRNELLHGLQSLLDQHPFNQQRIVLPVDMHRSQETNLKPTMTLEHPRDIHYYVDPVPRLDYDPGEHANRPVEIHYHLPPKATHNTQRQMVTTTIMCTCLSKSKSEEARKNEQENNEQ